MRKNFICHACSLLVLVLFCIGTGAALAAEPVSGIDNLLQGTKYEQLLAERGNSPRLPVPDKGFLPNLGNYFDSANPGWGLDIQAAGNFLFAVWFTYNPDGTPTWFIIVGELTAKGGGMSITGNIESFKWDPGGDPGSQATATIVGTMTIAWTDESNANVSWTLDGEDGGAPVSFVRFALPPTPANMTGHYFDANRSGWGFTMLTQGEVTVMTVYWYKDGQPVWAQGVVTRPGFGGFVDLLYFTGPGLCPSCLDKRGPKGGPGTEPLANVSYTWSLDDPPFINISETIFGPEDGPLGTEPFGDIFLPVVTEAITSAAGDNFDPEYTWFINTISDIGGQKGPTCLPFEYDTGIFAGDQDGTLVPAYFKLEPEEGSFPMYLDASCTQPWEILNFDGDRNAPSGLMMAWTGEDGVAYKWSAWYPSEAKGNGDGKEEGLQGSISVKQPLNDKGAQFNISWYGFRRFILVESGGQKGFVLVDGASPESLDRIEQDPGDLLFTRFVYP